MRNAAKHHGRPMIVIAMIAAAITQASAAARPPKISHRMLSRNDSGDMARDLLPFGRSGQAYESGERMPMRGRRFPAVRRPHPNAGKRLPRIGIRSPLSYA